MEKVPVDVNNSVKVGQEPASGAVSMAASETRWASISIGLCGLNDDDKSLTNCQNVLTNKSMCNDFVVLFLPARSSAFWTKRFS